jgi:carbon storage regulator CsrA
MLVLTRKHQEKIRIGEHITITVLKTKGKAVRLGIEAPAEVSVIRGELAFEGHAVEWQPKDDNGEAAAPRKVCAEKPHGDRIQAHWPAKSEPRSESTRPPGQPTAQVSLQRVSREQVKQMLPTLVSGDGPLRAMLDRRSVTA